MSFIGWLDYSEAEQRQVRELMQMFADKGTVDDLGVGTVRDSISNRLFPGTSVIQTRARYFLFIPWIFQRAESKHRMQLLERAEAMERRLIEALRSSEDQEGLIGRQAGKDVRTLPSAIYWTGLAAYGIFLHPGMTRAQYARVARTTSRSAPVEDELAERSASFWHRGIPAPPDGFFDFSGASFAMTGEEASWLSERVLSTEPMRGPNLLGDYVRELSNAPTGPAERFWDGPLPADVTDETRGLVRHAELFSAAVQPAALLYNLMLAEQRADSARGDDERADALRFSLLEWAEEAEASGIADWADDLTGFWAHVTTRSSVPPLTRAFVDQWAAVLRDRRLDGLADDRGARSLVRAREQQHKKAQARFGNPARLRDWNGESGLARLEYRWSQVRRFLVDLSGGLHGAEVDRAEVGVAAD